MTNNPLNYIEPVVQPTDTPNRVVSSVNARKVLNVTITTLAVVVGTVIAVDGASQNIDLSEYTIPASMGILYLAGVFNIAVTFPNYPTFNKKGKING